MRIAIPTLESVQDKFNILNRLCENLNLYSKANTKECGEFQYFIDSGNSKLKRMEEHLESMVVSQNYAMLHPLIQDI